MNAPLLIRHYVSSDCTYLASLFYETVHTVNAKDYSKEQLAALAPSIPNLTLWNKSFLEHTTLVAIKHNKVVGFGDIDSFGYIDRLFVHKDYQRQGIASLLCDKLEKNYQKVTTHASITAKPFFQSRGYVLVKEQQVVRDNISLTNFLMEKTF